MANNELIISYKNGVRTIQLNRPRTRNAFNEYFYSKIAETLNEDAKNDKIVVTILTGIGEYYSSGFDIKSAMASLNGDGSDKLSYLSNMIEAFINYPKLLKGLVNGPAIGIAVTTLALCDIVYASEKAIFEVPFIKIGLCAEGCSSYTFPRILGRSKASEMLLLGKKITAQEAYQFGFVAKVIPHNNLVQFLGELQQFGTLSVNSVMRTKKLIMENYKNTFLECNKREMGELLECFSSEEFAQGIVNFMSRKSKL